MWSPFEFIFHQVLSWLTISLRFISGLNLWSPTTLLFWFLYALGPGLRVCIYFAQEYFISSTWIFWHFPQRGHISLSNKLLITANGRSLYLSNLFFPSKSVNSPRRFIFVLLLMVFSSLWDIVRCWDLLLQWMLVSSLWEIVRFWDVYSDEMVVSSLWEIVRYWDFVLQWIVVSSLWEIVHCWDLYSNGW